MGGREATPPTEGIGKVHFMFWVLRKRARLSGKAWSIPPAGGSVSPCRPCAEAKRLPGFPVLLLCVTWISHVQLPRPLPWVSIPTPAPFTGESRRVTLCPAHPRPRMHPEFLPSVPRGMPAHLHSFSIPLDCCQAGDTGRRSGPTAPLWCHPQHSQAMPIHPGSHALCIPSSALTRLGHTASSQIWAAHPCFTDWDRALEGQSELR